MIFRDTGLPGAWLIEPQRAEDERGHFARTFCAETFAEHGLCAAFAQSGTSFNIRRGTLRGLHFQTAPYEECKLIRCTRGAVFDVAADLRPDSLTFGRWFGAELSAENGRMMYLPEGFAHGFQTLTDGAELSYQLSAPYAPAHARGIRWDDHTLAIEWPATDRRIISDRDRGLPLLAEWIVAQRHFGRAA